MQKLSTSIRKKYNHFFVFLLIFFFFMLSEFFMGWKRSMEHLYRGFPLIVLPLVFFQTARTQFAPVRKLPTDDSQLLSPHSVEHGPDVIAEFPGGIHGGVAAVVGEFGEQLDGLRAFSFAQ